MLLNHFYNKVSSLKIVRKYIRLTYVEQLRSGNCFKVNVCIFLSIYCRDMKPVADALGLFFQIRDDYANLHSKEVAFIFVSCSKFCTLYKIIGEI